MTSGPFAEPSTAADDIRELVSFLHREHSSAFVYRGQTRAWPPPLFPSSFRYYTRVGNVFDRDSTLPIESLRGCGRQFHELEPINFLWEFADRFCPETKLSVPELNVIDELADDPFLSLSLIGRHNCSFASEVSPEMDERFCANYGAWKQVIDQLHRNRIRQLVCLNPFGYVLGMAIAQHYGFGSEALDVTHDPIVAGFFATHDGPEYDHACSEGVGVVLRFRIDEKDRAVPEALDRDLYNAPGFVDLAERLSPFISPWMSFEGTVSNLVDRVEVALARGDEGRSAHRLQLGSDAFARTRVARQRGALLLSDLLLREKEMAGMKIQQFIAVEDINTRSAESFYFRHTADPWPFTEITREYLWPDEDVFVEMFSFILSTSFPMVLHPTGMALPKRPDLIDRGYVRR